MGWPGHIAQTSLAALSQTVNTKSSFGAPGLGNSSQLLLNKPMDGQVSSFELAQRFGSNRSRGMGAAAAYAVNV